ncbi:hypothetical protein K490DRAFT_61892 [Saccharata proteae CBS 121410]|uniref:Uncharacterized protein n=1 Tax=Saccharata proteae CBS 121410 TaxID=1314787 RepID=A0A9P4HZ55_9PEZI|nr:hypothetical protein K490DRAFT_61892 [Saccharata proteae CBS 121410]
MTDETTPTSTKRRLDRLRTYLAGLRYRMRYGVPPPTAPPSPQPPTPSRPPVRPPRYPRHPSPAPRRARPVEGRNGRLPRTLAVRHRTPTPPPPYDDDPPAYSSPQDSRPALNDSDVAERPREGEEGGVEHVDRDTAAAAAEGNMWLSENGDEGRA